MNKHKQGVHKGLKVFLYLAIGVIVYGLFCGVCLFFAATKTETTNIADYGKYTGNIRNDLASQFINSFFPDDISDSFSDISYSYRAERMDSYAFEAYLEFTIHDRNAFEEYINSIANPSDWQVFRYDDDFKEFSILNGLTLARPETGDYGGFHIRWAKIGKILYSAKEQRVIYVALGVDKGGAASTSYLNAFFSRFNIDPREYEKTAISEADYKEWITH